MHHRASIEVQGVGLCTSALIDAPIFCGTTRVMYDVRHLQNDVCGTNMMRLKMPVSHLFTIAEIISSVPHEKSIFCAHSTGLKVFFRKVSFPAGPSL